MFKDNREFLTALEKHDQLVKIKQQVDWDLEAGAIVRRSCEQKGPGVLFEKIKDYKGFKMFGAVLNTYPKLAIALDLDPKASVKEIQDSYLRKTKGQGVKPVLVDKKKAPCKQNIVMGDDVDLFALPIPMVHEGDGGRYVGTWHFVVCKDSDTGEINWGMYRQMAFDRQTMAGLILPGSDMGRMLAKTGGPVPFATAIGPDPLAGLAAQAPTHLPEDEFTGMLMEKPIEVVKCETCDLEVPAHAEIIIEGEVIPDVSIEEGPFGEYTGFRTSPREPRAVYKVKAITYRDNPIMTFSNMGMPVDEGNLLRAFVISLEMKRFLLSNGLPVKDVYQYPESAHHLVVVSIKPTINNLATRVANLIFGHRTGVYLTHVAVVEEDVDVFSWEAVMHALFTRCHPVRGIRVYEHSVGNPLFPFLNMEERLTRRSPQVLFDCVFPTEWDKRIERPALISFEENYPEDIKKRVLENWANYGFKE